MKKIIVALLFVLLTGTTTAQHQECKKACNAQFPVPYSGEVWQLCRLKCCASFCDRRDVSLWKSWRHCMSDCRAFE